MKIPNSFGKAHDGYIQLADNLRQGNGYVFEKGGPPVFHRPPLYPILLVPVTYFPAQWQRPVLILMQSLMVGCIGSIIFMIARRLFGCTVPAISVLIFALNPCVYFNVKNPMTTITQGLLYTVLAVLVGMEFLNGGQLQQGAKGLWRKRLAIAAAGAALTLTHGTMLAVTGSFLLILFAAGIVRKNYQTVRTAVIAAAMTAVLIAPWTYRNWVVFHRFIPVAGGAGLAYFNGLVHWKDICPQPQREGEEYIDASLRVAGIDGNEAQLTHWKGFKDIALEDRMNRKMADDIREHPAGFAKKIALNAIEYYFPTLAYPFLAMDFYKGGHVPKLGVTIYHLILWTLAVAGVLKSRRDGLFKSAALMLAAVFLYAVWFLPFATFIGHSLYTFGTMPFLSILAAKGIAGKR